MYVFNRIEINEHKDEIKCILNTEMLDFVCKCFTGHMSRLVNIQIADNKQISQSNY